MIPVIVEGFNLAASRVYLALFPITFDLLLWFGPLVRVKALLLPFMNQALDLSGPAYGAQGAEFVQASKQLWADVLESFNVLFGLRTYPIGIPSLMVSQGGLSNPLGALRIIELASPENALWLALGTSMAGILLGSIYFLLVSRAALPQEQPLNLKEMLDKAGQSVILTLMLVGALLVLGVPAMCLISSVVLFMPALGALPLMLIGILSVWVLLPLAFAPHGIFAGDLKAGRSVVQSIQLVRGMMSLAGMLFIVVILLGYGLDVLWATPGVESWMMLIGIFGHGFISCGLLAATFVFYRDGLKWLAEVQRQRQAAVQKA